MDQKTSCRLYLWRKKWKLWKKTLQMNHYMEYGLGDRATGQRNAYLWILGNKPNDFVSLKTYYYLACDTE